MARVLITAPNRVRANQPFDVKLLIGHPMESGHRRDTMGQAIPREIIHSLTATLGEEVVFEATLHPAIAANPYFAFRAVARRSGALTFRLVDDLGAVQTESVLITVEPAA